MMRLWHREMQWVGAEIESCPPCLSLALLCFALVAWSRDKENIVGMKTSLWVMSLHIPNTSIACVASFLFSELGNCVRREKIKNVPHSHRSFLLDHFMNIWRTKSKILPSFTHYSVFYLTLIVMKWDMLSRIWLKQVSFCPAVVQG